MHVVLFPLAVILRILRRYHCLRILVVCRGFLVQIYLRHLLRSVLLDRGDAIRFSKTNCVILPTGITIFSSFASLLVSSHRFVLLQIAFLLIVISRNLLLVDVSEIVSRRCGRVGIVVLLRREFIVGIRVHSGIPILEATAHKIIVAAGALRVQLLLDSTVNHYSFGDWDWYRIRERLLVGPVLESPNVDRSVDHRHRVAHLTSGLYYRRDIAHGIQPGVDLINVGTRKRRGDLAGTFRLRSPRLFLSRSLLIVLRRAASRVRFDDRRFACLATKILGMMVPDVPVQVVLASEWRLAVLTGERLLV